MTESEIEFQSKVASLIEIHEDLDEYGSPKRKLLNCPRCDEDELGVIHADLILCYRCRWELRSRIKNQS